MKENRAFVAYLALLNWIDDNADRAELMKVSMQRLYGDMSDDQRRVIEEMKGPAKLYVQETTGPGGECEMRAATDDEVISQSLVLKLFLERSGLGSIRRLGGGMFVRDATGNGYLWAEDEQILRHPAAKRLLDCADEIFRLGLASR